ncbi:Altered inheritance of mitochondria protein 21 [Teratosphaeria destructans]|uniref:Altered inheritance of mitochondria protein 21 n=1 Tax=Teratosphaeria destructans TaxID=418781 RepID=A0A9W7SJY4_9PEZI|nr:Altered inheritance of mitochondria protein 21 [Teratosphaeria destructans]
MTTPQVPPRPAARSQAGPTEVKQQPPVPARPVRKTAIDQLQADREASSRSPLNLPPREGGRPQLPVLQRQGEHERRPSTINLPSEVGQEGLEYTSYDQLPPGAQIPSEADAAAADQTRNVTADVPLQQPKASHPQSTTTSRISTVTRTDSTQAAAAGIGKARPDDDVHKVPASTGSPLTRVTSAEAHHPLSAKASWNRSNSNLHNASPRPPSAHAIDHDGIPEIGMQVPLLAHAGDVQAPSPAPTLPQHTPGVGFFNDGSQRNHHRKRSSRHEFHIPPDSYGLHGHGLAPQDQFERDWYAKHPDEALKEHYNAYALRPETALSSDQLNRIVSNSDDVGMGTSPSAIGTPDQDIAFEATDQYASRMNSPRPSPAVQEAKKRPSSSHLVPESPLRKSSFPFDENRAHESEDEDKIHVDPPLRRGTKVTGGGAMDGKLDLGPTGGNTTALGGWHVETGDDIPILASDELIKRPGSAYMTPAVEPDADDSDYHSDHPPPSRRGSRPSSRPSSLYGNYHGGPLHRFISHEDHHGSGVGTPLEEIEEYEPLFPEDDKEEARPKKSQLARPGLAHHHFPSQDIWEDTPSSLQYQTTVETPEPPRERAATLTQETKPTATFETPEDEERRKRENPADMLSDKKTFAKPHFKPGVEEDLHHRPGVQRFPSRDIWEDTPDSMRLVTTVGSPQMDEIKSPPEDRPTTAALPLSQDDMEARSTTGLTQVMRPSIPARPERRSKLAQDITDEIKPESDDSRAKQVPDLGSNQQQLPDRSKPTIPERPKPSVPARPTRAEPSEGTGAQLAKSASATSAGSDGSNDPVTSAAAPKAKPIVPARPAGNKIAALQAGFMNDLNNRLKLGPQGPAPKVKEPEAEADAETAKEPLADARKGRAKGPPRRKAAVSPAKDGLGLSFSTPMTLFSINEKDEVTVPADVVDTKAPEVQLEKEMTMNEMKNTQEPTMLTKSESLGQENPAAQIPHLREALGFEGDQPDPSISPAVVDEHKQVQPELEAALAQSKPEDSPASAEAAAEIQGKETTSRAVQTGQKDLGLTSGEGETERVTAYAGGRVPEEGDVLVRDAEA